MKQAPRSVRNGGAFFGMEDMFGMKETIGGRETA